MLKIALSGKYGIGRFVLLDNNTSEKILNTKWHVNNNGYVKSGNKYLHRIIMKAQKGDIVDHINQNVLDNRSTNLRLVDKGENSLNSKIRCDNTSGFIGVTFNKSTNKWRAQIKLEHRNLYIGEFIDKTEAAYIRDQFCLQLHGSFTRSYFLGN